MLQSPIVPLLTRTVAGVGAALVRLVTDPSLEGTTGRYFAGIQERHSSQNSYDTAKARQIWDDSASLVGL